MQRASCFYCIQQVPECAQCLPLLREKFCHRGHPTSSNPVTPRVLHSKNCRRDVREPLKNLHRQERLDPPIYRGQGRCKAWELHDFQKKDGQ